MAPGSDPIPPLTFTWNGDVYFVDYEKFMRLGFIECDGVILRGTVDGSAIIDLVVVETVKAQKA